MAKRSQARGHPLIYVAGPLFNSHQRWYLEQVAAALERAGYRTFLPHRDAGVLDRPTPVRRRRVFRQDLAALRRSAAIVALLTGSDHDSGTCGELGFMFAQGKPCFGLSDDIRWRNNLIWGLCGEGRQMAATIQGLLRLVNQRLRKRRRRAR